MRELIVRRTGILDGQETLEGAINAAKRHPLQKHALACEEKLKDRLILEAFWSDSSFTFVFEHDFTLHIYLTDKEVTWEVSSMLLKRSDGLSKNEEAVAMLIETPVGTEHRYVMDRRRLINERRNSRLTRLWVNELGFYVYTEKQRILGFSAMYCTQLNTNVLMVYEDD